MTDQNRNELARKAHQLFACTEIIQNVMLEMFTAEFMALDEQEEEQSLIRQREGLPF